MWTTSQNPYPIYDWNLQFSLPYLWPERVASAKGLFTWREGAPANRPTQLEGLKHSPPLHATHLTGTVSGLRELSFERPLSTTNIMADKGSFFLSYFSFLHGHGPVLCLRLIYYIDLFTLTVILFDREHWQMVTRKKFTSRRHVFAVYHTSVSWDNISPARTVYVVKSNPA